MKKDLTTFEDVKLLVNEFYSKIREDELLGPIFNNVIKDKWPEHLDKMYRFWQTILLEEHTYYGSPFPPHSKLPIDKVHFERWLNIFKSVVNEYFEGENATAASMRAQQIANVFQYKIEHLNTNSS